MSSYQNVLIAKSIYFLFLLSNLYKCLTSILCPKHFNCFFFLFALKNKKIKNENKIIFPCCISFRHFALVHTFSCYTGPFRAKQSLQVKSEKKGGDGILADQLFRSDLKLRLPPHLPICRGLHSKRTLLLLNLIKTTG